MLKSIATDLAMIKKELAEPGRVCGAYYQDYGAFREIYRFVARGLSRSGQMVYILLCTLTDAQGEIPEQNILQPAMAVLREVIMYSLRRGDLFAQYSAAQYIIMLPATAFEDSAIVIDRIVRKFENQAHPCSVVLHCLREPMDPVE